MTTYQASSLNEILDGKSPIPVGKLAYFRERQRNRLYDFLISKFLEHEKNGEISRADLARRIDKDPAQITKWLASPGNWTLDTISDLTLAICAGELDFHVSKLADIRPRNVTQFGLLEPSLMKVAQTSSAVSGASFPQHIIEAPKPIFNVTYHGR